MKKSSRFRHLLLLAGALFILSLLSVSALAATNLLINGSFDGGTENGLAVGWGKDPYNGTVVRQGFDGDYCLKITNDTQEVVSLGAQTFDFDARQNRYLTVGGYVKAENVKAGKEAWQQANIQVLFLDSDGKQVGGWPQIGPWDSSFGWTKIKKTFIVPAETRKVKIVVGLFNCLGTVYFDDLYADSSYQKENDPTNLLENGKFEIWEDWVYAGSPSGGITSPGYNSLSALRVKNSLPLWSFASQPIALTPNIKKIRVEAMVKLDGIEQGSKPWQQARLNLEFKDEFGKRMDGWPIVYSGVGSSDWKKVENTFDVPAGAKRVDVFAGILETKGTVWFDDMRVEGFDENGRIVSKTGFVTTDKSNWFAVSPSQTTQPGSALDVSFLLDKPAGKNGFMTVRDGHFTFANGKRARFWGTNLVGKDCFLSKDEAKLTAERLARAGYNLVRLHHMDAFWATPNLFDPKFNDTQHLSADSLDKLDYLIYQLKLNGIYVLLDLMVDRQFKEGDGVRDYDSVERGAKFSGFFNPRIIELQKLFAQQMLTHFNPYTKTAYKDEPSVVSVKLINEALLYYISLTPDLPQSYVKEFDGLWNSWLIKKYGNVDNLRAAWTDKYGRCDLGTDEDPLQGTVKRGKTLHSFQRDASIKIDPLRERDTMLFYAETQTAYYQSMAQYIRSLGVRVPISGSNHWVNIDADKKSNASLDYIDIHHYWDHPQFGYGTQVLFEDFSQLKLPKVSIPVFLGSYRVANKPVMISEWNACFPNEWRADAPLFMSAYASLQETDALLQFSYGGTKWGSLMQDNFNVNDWPNVFNLTPAAVLSYYRGDVAPGKNVVEETLSDRELYGPIFEDRTIWDSPYLPLIARTQKRYVSSPSEIKYVDIDPILKQNLNEAAQTLTSDTKQLNWDFGKGVFKIDTPRTQAVLGFIAGGSYDTKNLTVKISNPHGVISLTSLSSSPIATASRMLVSASGRVENSGQKFNSSKTMLQEVGGGPVLVEPLSGEISIKRAGKPTVWALDLGGKRVKTIAVQSSGGKSTFRLDPANKAINYEVVY